VEGALDAEALLAQSPDRARRVRAAAAAGEAVRTLHDAGVLHGDLHLKNLLLLEQGDRTRALLADLEPGRWAPQPDPRRRMAEIMRLYRSIVKRRLLDTAGPEVLASFLEAYTRGDPTLRAALLAHLRRERRRVALHALGYRLLDR
jgi:tRNA A-37 threonylcarbamoyl transferase component Bud32